MNKSLSMLEKKEFMETLKTRFENNMSYHQDMNFENIKEKLDKNPDKLWSLYQMEITGGEPDVLLYDKESDTYTFYDTSKESPIGRRSLCYDETALNTRKENKPKGSANGMCLDMGVDLLDEDGYLFLQTKITCDTKTSSWIKTPSNIRSLGGALFKDFRYDTVFTYHNGADSYYSSRGFRASLKVEYVRKRIL